MLKYDGPKVAVSHLRVTDYKDLAMRAIDTDALVRAIVNDDTAQSERAVALLTVAEVFIPVTVMLELKRVLRSRYAFTPKVVAQAIAK